MHSLFPEEEQDLSRLISCQRRVTTLFLRIGEIVHQSFANAKYGVCEDISQSKQLIKHDDALGFNLTCWICCLLLQSES